MLELDRRELYCNLLIPPDGFVAEAFLATSYSVDLEVVAMAALALADYGTDLRPAEVSAIELLHAFMRSSNRMAVFCDITQIRRPAGRNRLYPIFDRILVPVSRDRGRASFHPKLFLVKYRPRFAGARRDREASRYRLSVLSRNMSLWNAREVAASFEGKLDSGGDPIAGKLRTFLARLAEETKLLPARREMLGELVRDLARIRFALPTGVSGAELDLQFGDSKGDDLSSNLPGQMDRLAVISPFVGAGMVRELARRAKELWIFSTACELGKLPEDLKEQLGDRLRMLDPCPEDSFSREETAPGPQDKPSASSVHAKIYAGEIGGKTLCFVGSPNCTGSAWKGRNAEALVRFALPREAVYQRETTKGTVPWLDGFLDAWIRHCPPYQEQPEDPDLVLGESLEDRVAEIKAGLAETGWALEVAGGGIPDGPLDIELWAKHPHALEGVLEKCRTPLLSGALPSHKVDLSLYSLPSNRLPLDSFRQPRSFHLAGLQEVSRFLVASIDISVGKVSRRERILLLADVADGDLLSHRDEEIVRGVLSNVEDLNRYLRLILFQESPDAGGVPPVNDPPSGGTAPGASVQATQNGLAVEEVTVEDLLLYCGPDPDGRRRLAEIGHVISTLRARKNLPKELECRLDVLSRTLSLLSGVKA